MVSLNNIFRKRRLFQTSLRQTGEQQTTAPEVLGLLMGSSHLRHQRLEKFQRCFNLAAILDFRVRFGPDSFAAIAAPIAAAIYIHAILHDRAENRFSSS